MNADYNKLNNAYFIDDLSVSYTLFGDDITRGEKPQGTPYLSRKDKFDKNGFAKKTQSRLSVCKKGGGYLIVLRTHAEDISEFGLNLPFNFMGKKNAGGWRNQYLFNSPYASDDNKHIFCYLTNPNGKNLLVMSLGKAAGWKMDYSLFSGGQYFENLKFLYSFDRTYNGGEKSEKVRILRLYIAETQEYLSALQTFSAMKKVPAAYFEKSYAKIGEEIKIRLFGDCDYVKIAKFKGKAIKTSEVKSDEKGEKYAIIKPEKYGLWSIIPYKNGKRGLNCTVFAYENMQSLYKKSVFSVSLADLATGDGNLCEWKCHVPAILRYMQKYGKSPALVKKVKSELDLITTRNESYAIDRQTIFYKARAGYPAYNVFNSTRIQEQFFAVTILLDAYKLFGVKKYLTYAVKTLECALKYYQKADGRIEKHMPSAQDGEPGEDYTTVCCPLIPVVEVAEFLKGCEPEKSAYFYACAEKMAEYVYNRGFLFPTETDRQTLAEPFVEEGSISCSALTLLYYCARVKRVEKYVVRAKEFLDLHDNWVVQTHIAPMYYSSLRWWETKWEGDKDGNALCCGHAWTIWRAEADYRYYEVTGDKRYLERAKNGFMSNFSKITESGQSYACYQPDYITGGGFTTRGEDVNFRVVRNFPMQTDSGLSRYVWIRYADGIDFDKNEC